jgi:hypothetical protein
MQVILPGKRRCQTESLGRHGDVPEPMLPGKSAA